MAIQETLLSDTELKEELKQRGYRAEAFLNETGQVCGFYMRGPRGHKRFITPDENGFYLAMIVSLWCDGVDYAERKLEESRRRTG